MRCCHKRDDFKLFQKNWHKQIQPQDSLHSLTKRYESKDTVINKDQ